MVCSRTCLFLFVGHLHDFTKVAFHWSWILFAAGAFVPVQISYSTRSCFAALMLWTKSIQNHSTAIANQSQSAKNVEFLALLFCSLLASRNLVDYSKGLTWHQIAAEGNNSKPFVLHVLLEQVFIWPCRRLVMHSNCVWAAKKCTHFSQQERSLNKCTAAGSSITIISLQGELWSQQKSRIVTDYEISTN